MPYRNQETAVPTAKVTVGALGGSLAAILAWMLAELWQIDMPPGTEGAFATLLAFALAYIVPERA